MNIKLSAKSEKGPLEDVSVDFKYRPVLKTLSAAAAAASLQSCPTLCDPIDGSPAGSTVPGILQARRMEWAAKLLAN